MIFEYFLLVVTRFLISTTDINFKKNVCKWHIIQHLYCVCVNSLCILMHNSILFQEFYFLFLLTLTINSRRRRSRGNSSNRLEIRVVFLSDQGHLY